MRKIDQLSPLIKLVLRSPDVGDGWRTVSGMLEQSVKDTTAIAPELFEIEETPMRIRLSPDGNVVSRYL